MANAGAGRDPPHSCQASRLCSLYARFCLGAPAPPWTDPASRPFDFAVFCTVGGLPDAPVYSSGLSLAGQFGLGAALAVKKSQLYSSLWNSCDELRGGMDASQYKDYILVLLFVKYVSDRTPATLMP